jgi:hypothetical protein
MFQNVTQDYPEIPVARLAATSFWITLHGVSQLLQSVFLIGWKKDEKKRQTQ